MRYSVTEDGYADIVNGREFMLPTRLIQGEVHRFAEASGGALSGRWVEAHVVCVGDYRYRVEFPFVNQGEPPKRQEPTTPTPFKFNPREYGFVPGYRHPDLKGIIAGHSFVKAVARSGNAVWYLACSKTSTLSGDDRWTIVSGLYLKGDRDRNEERINYPRNVYQGCISTPEYARELLVHLLGTGSNDSVRETGEERLTRVVRAPRVRKEVPPVPLTTEEMGGIEETLSDLSEPQRSRMGFLLDKHSGYGIGSIGSFMRGERGDLGIVDVFRRFDLPLDDCREYAQQVLDFAKDAAGNAKYWELQDSSPFRGSAFDKTDEVRTRYAGFQRAKLVNTAS